MPKKTIVSAVALCLTGLPLGPSASRAFGGGPTASNDAWMQAARRAGRQADVGQVERLTKALRDGSFAASDPDAEATLLSLSQIGSADALPAIETFIEQQRKKDEAGTDAVNAARAAPARIVARQVGEAVPAGLMARRFYSALQETPEQINSDVAAYAQARSKPAGIGLTLPPPLGVYALRQVADMAYRSSDEGFTKTPEVAALRFDLDPRSALKVRLAPLSDTGRAAWLTQELSRSKVVAEKEDCEIQLAGDLEAVVEPLAAAKVQVMSANRDKYPSVAFDALFGVLSLSGKPGQALVKQYQQDKEPMIAQYARQFGAGSFVAGY